MVEGRSGALSGAPRVGHPCIRVRLASCDEASSLRRSFAVSVLWWLVLIVVVIAVVVVVLFVVRRARRAGSVLASRVSDRGGQ